jgi:hypothetical protein
MKKKIVILILIIIIIITLIINKKSIENFKDYLYNSDFYKSIKLDKIDVYSPYNGDSLFKIYLNKEYDVIYKKSQEGIRKYINIDEYKDIIYSLKDTFIINKYIYKPENIYIEDDGSYYSIYIVNGVTLYDILYNNKKIDNKTKDKIIEKLGILRDDLNTYINNYNLFGDWNPSNIMYNYDDENLYNIDYEGFGTIGYFHIAPYNEKNPFDYINKLILQINEI